MWAVDWMLLEHNDGVSDVEHGIVCVNVVLGIDVGVVRA